MGVELADQQSITNARSFREILLEVRDSVKEIKEDMGSIKRVLFGHEDRLGLVARVVTLEAKMKLIGWGVAVVAISVLGLLFEIFTGKVSIIFH